jgi:hypothetical protein
MIRFGRELPDPLELVVKGHEEQLIGFACPKCGAAFLVHKREDPAVYAAHMADERDNAAVHCVKECVCGKPIERSYHLRCDACCAQMEVDKERKRFEKAEKFTIEQYDDPVYWEGHSASMGDGYFADIEEVLDYCENEGVDVPEYVWACTREDMKIDAQGVVECAVENMYEDAYDHIDDKAVAKLQAYLDVWCKEVAIVGWSEDNSRAILLHEHAQTASAG